MSEPRTESPVPDHLPAWKRRLPWLGARPLTLRMPRLPSLCAICRGWGASLVCTACVQRFAPFRSRCAACAIAVPSGVRRCSECIRRPTGLDFTAAAVDYVWPWSSLIARFKYAEGTELCGALARMAVEAWLTSASGAPQCELVLPVPAAPARLRDRGYNHAGLLARRVAGSLGLSLDVHALVTTRELAWQHAASAQERHRNVKHAFAVVPSRQGRLAGRHILLVDDVMTTGATMSELSSVLRRQGAASVSALVVARTPRPG